MSLIDYSYRMSRKSDVAQKIDYIVFIDTSGATPVVVGDPTAILTMGTITNGIIFYLMVKGDYETFSSVPLPPTQLTYSPLCFFRGCVKTNGVSLAADAASVVYIQGNPDNVFVPPNYTLFPFICVSPLTGFSVIPSLGISINIEITQYPLFQYEIVISGGG